MPLSQVPSLEILQCTPVSLTVPGSDGTLLDASQFYIDWCNQWRLQCSSLAQCEATIECLDGRRGEDVTTAQCLEDNSSDSSESSESKSSKSLPSTEECLEEIEV